MKEYCKTHAYKIVSLFITSGILIGDLIVTVLSNVGLKLPVFDSTNSKLVFLFPTIGFGMCGFLGLILAIYRDTMAWLLNIHLVTCGLTIVIALTSFVALSSGVKTYDLSQCVSNIRNSTCDCREEVDINISCTDLTQLHIILYIVYGTYMLCGVLCFCECVRAIKWICCSDEIPDIPGILDDEPKTTEKNKSIYVIPDKKYTEVYDSRSNRLSGSKRKNVNVRVTNSTINELSEC